MAKSRAFDKFINMCYGLGASVVIIGALFKILHFEIGVLTGGVMLTIGLCTEAFIFAVSAFEPLKPKYNWAAVWPEILEGEPGEAGASKGKKGKKEAQKEQDELDVSLSKKLDEMLKEAKVDAQLMESLGSSIKNFEGAAKNMAPTAEAMDSQKRYSEEMSLAAAQMESLNNLYKVQLESSSKQAEANDAIANNAKQLQEQMESLTSNISNLNSVYGNMLTAMRPNS